MGPTKAPMDRLTRGMNRLHRAIWAISGHRLLKNPSGMPAVELHTTGRRSGGAAR